MTKFDSLVEIPALPSGDEFEELVWSILQRRYPPEKLRYFPAEMGGDKGLEGFSSDGIAYQCYADENSIDLRQRTDKQRAKLNRDTLKLKKNEDELLALLDGVKIQYFFLIVPQFHATELVAYANTRAKEVREWGLPFICSDFEILIKTPEDYPGEYQAALQDAVASIQLPEPSVSDDQIEGFVREEPALLATLGRKLETLKGIQPNVKTPELSKTFTKWYLIKEDMMESLKSMPQTREAVESQRRMMQEDLEFKSEFGETQTNQSVMKIVDEYAENLHARVAGLKIGDAKRLSRGQAGEWVMRCPIDFKAG